MLAFHNDPAIKYEYLSRVRLHKAADEILQGYGYWENGRGCAVGCTIHGCDHFAYERKLGIPAPLAFLEDRIFEGLPVEKAKEWPELFLSAIRTGADLSKAKVWQQFAAWLLDDPIDGVIRFANTNATRNAVHHVAQLFREDCIDMTRWRAAADAAFAADAADETYLAAGAATLAAYAADYRVFLATDGTNLAARVAAYAAGFAAFVADAADAAGFAADAAGVAAYAAEQDATADEEFIRQSEQLLALLRAA